MVARIGVVRAIKGGITMKTIVTFAVAAGCALALAACGDKTSDAPAAEPTAAEPELMAPVATPSVSAQDDLEPTANPIGMGAPAGQ